jgi:hypothetical protein
MLNRLRILLEVSAVVVLLVMLWQQTSAATAPPRPMPPVSLTPLMSAAGPVYRVDQVLALWHHTPSAVLDHSLLVHAHSYSACVAPEEFQDQTIPCIQPYNAPVWSMLYDPATHAEIPTIIRLCMLGCLLDDPVMASGGFHRRGYMVFGPVPTVRISFVQRQDCGPLGRDQHPCLLGVDPQQYMGTNATAPPLPITSAAPPW